MEQKNKILQPFFLIFSAFVILMCFSFFDSSFEIKNFQFKKVDVLSELRLKGTLVNAPLSNRMLTDSIIAKDSLAYLKHKSNPAAIIEFGTDSMRSLSCFFGALSELSMKRKKVRIAYFGDSMIEGDLITQDFRENLQDTFGGMGVGYMPITSIVAGFRQSIIHTFSDNWTIYNLLDANSSNHSLGMSGYDFIPALVSKADSNPGKTGCWVKYIATKRPHLDKFTQVKLFYGNGSDADYVNISGQIFKLNGQHSVNEISLNASSYLTAMQANFSCSSLVNIFGFSIEGDSGVYVDNFSFRGNSGMPLTKITAQVLSGINNFQDYNLIILHYGVNVVSSRVTDFSWYERGMTEVIKHFQSVMPNASILIITTPDKSIRQKGVMITDPSVPLVVEVQKKVAQKTGVAFWNLYEAMGGDSAMVRWVEGDTVYANKDYTHPNFRGAKRIADMLYGHLMTEYNAYAKKR